VTAGGDAEFLLDGLSIKKSSNTVSDVLQGTTLNLLKTNSGSPTTLTVAQDTSGIKKSVEDFVKAYNDVADSVKELTGYDAAAKKPGVLSGNTAIRSLAAQMRSTLSNVVSNIPGGYNALAQVGVSFDADGKLSVNSSKLDTALTTNPKAVQGLFATGGNSDDSLIIYKNSSSTTPAGKYALNVTQLATQGQAVGSAAADLTIDDSNDALSVTINGVSTSVSLAHGTYNDAGALAAELQSKLNGSSALGSAGASVTVSQTDGVLSLTSSTYGSSSKVKLNGGSADSSLFGTASYTDGLDVAGSFNGIPATGNGQTLTAGNGLSTSILGGATGERGALTFTRGVAVQLDNVLTQALASKGSIQSSSDGLQSQVKDMESQIAKLTDANAAKQARYEKQFNTLDGLLTNMQSTMSYLTQQLASLNSSTK
jgi:flagellar hook-associated protein 2